MQTEIRQAVLADAGEVTSCVCHAFISYIPLIGKQPQPMLEDYQALIKACKVFVLCKDNKIVGVLVLEQTKEGFCIETLAIHPLMQSLGLSKKLVAFAEKVASKMHYQSLYLSTNQIMHKAQAIYKHLGFVQYDQRRVNGYDRLFFRKTIG
jgi:N-acetylglutamate synthase-like GNAT family acetyltransferase